jgi:hypothetical protein
MKLLGKLALAAGIAGAAASIYAAPGTESTYTEAVARGIAIRESMQADYRHVLELQTRARKEKDLIKLNCVNDKLIEMKPQMNLADRLQVELQSTRDTAESTSLTALIQAGDAVHRLREAADQCVGERLLVGESSNEFTHPTIPDDPNVNPLGGATTVEPPAYASPFN